MGIEALLSQQIIGLSESIDDRVAALLVAGTGITLTYNDGAGTLTIANTGLGGSTGSTDNRILRADGTGGSTVQSSAVTIDDSGNISGLGTVTASGSICHRTATNNLVELTNTSGEGQVVFGNNTNTNTASIFTSSTGANLRISVGGLTRLQVGSSSVDVTGAITANNGTLTASSPVLNLTQTWNNAAVDFNGFNLGITDTASSSSSSILNINRNGTTLWRMTKTGALVPHASGNVTGLYYPGTGNGLAIRSPNNGRGMEVDGWSQSITIDSLSNGVNWNSATPLVPSSNTFDVRNGANAQAFRVYHGYTNASNYARAFMDFSGATFRFGTQVAGTGGTSNMELHQNGSNIISFNSGGKIFFHNRDITFGSWNGGEISLRQTTSFNGRLDVVDALTHSTYRDIAMGRVLVGGAPATTTGLIKNTSGTMNFRLGNDSADCNITAAEALFSGSVKFSGSTSAEPMLKRSGSTIQVRLADDSGFGGMAASAGSFTGQVSANNLMLNNYQWIGWGGLNLLAGDGAGLRANFCPLTQVTTFGCVTANVSGVLTHGFQTLVANPTTSDIASNSARLVKNTTSGEVRLWVNDGGTMKSVLLS